MNLLKLDKNNKVLDGPTVMIRIHDNQRDWMPPRGYTADVINQYLPLDRMAKFAFSPPTNANINPADQAKSAIPQALQQKEVF
jgi:hypothetical protein